MFRTSTFCAASECVEVGQDDMIIVRDTNDRSIMLEFDYSAWNDFIARLKS